MRKCIIIQKCPYTRIVMNCSEFIDRSQSFPLGHRKNLNPQMAFTLEIGSQYNKFEGLCQPSDKLNIRSSGPLRSVECSAYFSELKCKIIIEIYISTMYSHQSRISSKMRIRKKQTLV